MATNWDQYVEPSQTAPASSQTTSAPDMSKWDQYAPSDEKYAQYQDVQSKEPPAGFWDEFHNTITSPVENIMNDNLFVNIGHGVGRIAADIHDAGWDGASGVLAKELHNAWTGTKKVAEAQVPSAGRIGAELEQFDNFKQALQDHPGVVAGSLVNSLTTDPEMALIPVGFGGKFASAAGKEAADLGKVISKVASVSARIGESTAVGAAVGGGIEAGEQFKTGQYNPGDIWTAAEMSGTLGALTGIRAPKDIVRPEVPKTITPETPVSREPYAGIIPESLVDHPVAQQTIPEFLKAPYYQVPAFLEQVSRPPTKPAVPAFLETKALPAPSVKSFSVSPTGDVFPNYKELPIPEKGTLAKGKVIGAEPTTALTPEQEAAFIKAKMDVAAAKEPSQRTLEDLMYLRHKVAPDAKIITPDSLGYNLPPTQRGMAQSDVLKYLGLAAVGATAGPLLDPSHPVGSAIIGGIAASSGLWGLPKAIRAVKNMWGPMALGAAVGTWAMPEHKVEGAAVGAAAFVWGKRKLSTPTSRNIALADNLIWQNLNNKASYAWNMWAQTTEINRLVPKKDRQANISRYLDGSQHAPLSKEEMIVANAAKQFFSDTGQAAVDAGVLQGLRDNYVSHIIDWSGKSEAEIANIKQSILGDLTSKGSTISTTSRFAKQRTYDTFDELNVALAKYGAKLKTENISEIMSIYGNSMRKAIEDKTLIESLKHMKDERGRNLIDSPSRENVDYEYVTHPSIINLRVHPEVAPALKFIMNNKMDNITNGLHAISMIAKRFEIAANLFHAASLFDVAVGAGIPVKGFKSIMSGIPIVNKFIKAPEILDTFKKGSLGDDIDYGIRNGLKVRLPEDVDATKMNSVATQTGKWIDNAFKVRGAEKLGEKVTAFNHKLDQITWEHGYTGIKLSIYIKEMEKALLDNAAARTKDPSVPELTKQQASMMAAQYANDLGGGIDWFKVASGTKSQLMRKIAMTALSQRGRTMMQIGMFAPDWTFATFRSMYKGVGSMLPKQLNLPGVPEEAALRGMYRRYAMRSAVAYMIIANSINLAATGHYVWDNADPTKVELGDGRRMYLSKHSMEFANWIMNPRQEVWNKLGVVPSELAEQLSKKEYLSATGKAPDMGNPLSHLAMRFVPLPGQQLGTEGIGGVAASFLGRPIYGQAQKQKQAKKLEKSMKLSDVLKGRVR